MKSYDIVIVGAGSAGSVLASRLSQNSAARICVFEAGGFPDDPDIAVPQKWPMLQGRNYDWAYSTVPQAGTAGRVHPWPRGRIVGGSSCLHAMAHVRGHAEDFAPWAAASGSRRWSHEGLLPAFIRLESFSGPASAAHGQDGPLPIYLPDEELSPVVRAYMEAGLTLGVPRLADHNSGPLCGVSANTLTIRDGKRVSAADAYLTPDILARGNLDLVTGAAVHRLSISKGRVDGLHVEIDGRPEFVAAGRVILCAGTLASPLLLMRSGIGPAGDLKSAGLACLMDRPSVGANLHDHLLTAGNVYAARRPVPPSRLQHSESLMYLDAADIARQSGAPDVALACVAAPTVSECLAAPAYGSAYTILSGVTHPTSRGRLTVTGPDIADAPMIDPAYLSTGQDRAMARRALELARQVGHSPALDDWRAEEVLPGIALDAADIDSFIAKASITHHHPVGTCAFGAGDEDVVDADLRLRGLDNLFVVDASVIPTITSGPVHAAVLAIAETFAAEVAGDWN